MSATTGEDMKRIRQLNQKDMEFRADIAKKFRQIMKDRDWNQTEAARDLKVTKQAFSKYLKRDATPKAEILARAATRWGITFRYRGVELPSGAFQQKRGRPTESIQLDLFAEPQIFENEMMSVQIVRSSQGALQLTIRMKTRAVELMETLAQPTSQ